MRFQKVLCAVGLVVALVVVAGRSDGKNCLECTGPAGDCLAAGTRVTLADGSDVAIEDMGRMQHVQTDGAEESLGVRQVLVGVERRRLIHLEDDRGHALDLTGRHPVVTVDYGVMPADELEVGDLIVTLDGYASLREVVEEVGAEVRVYNLLLDTSSGSAREAGQTTFYANGILVGDARMEREILRADALMRR